jgi:hypothetical protein
MKNIRKAVMCPSVVYCSFFAACAPSATQQPESITATMDANLVYTQAAQTVAAGIAGTETARPSRTPSLTPEPTQTMDPEIAAGLTATIEAASQIAVTATPTVEGQAEPPGGEAQPAQTNTPLVGAALPTATQAAAAPQPSPDDRCEWVENRPRDNTQIQKNSDFEVTFVIRNTGTSTWNEKYALRYFAGDRMGMPADVFNDQEVKPNQAHSFVFNMKAPDSTGKKETLMVVQNPDGFTMCWFNLPVEIIE